ncbi:hypothetical protein [Lysobacter humi (ex Lee et al. 2017)]
MATARWLAPAALAAALGAAALVPAPAKAQSADLVRTIVDIADVVMRGNQPYYRHGDYSADDRLVMGRDRYGRPVYYRVATDPRYGYDNGYDSRYGYRIGATAPYGRAVGYHDNRGQRQKCNKHGKCKVEYYDPRADRRNYGYRGY